MRRAIRTSDELRAHAATDVDEDLDEERFRRQFEDLLGQAPSGVVRHWAFFSLSAGAPTWVDTGIDVAPGEAVTLCSTGRLLPASIDAEMTDDEKLSYGAAGRSEVRRGVWYRIGDAGPARRGTRRSHTVVAPDGGRLFLACRPIDDREEASDDHGERSRWTIPRVERFVVALCWGTDPVDGLAALRAIGDVGATLSSEIARQEAVIELPVGWHSPQGGECEQFTADLRAADGPVIGCFSRSSGALLQKDAHLPFLPGTTFRWSWKHEQLASRVPEDRLATHDYLSIAVEFDNGHDLTYYWSGALPVGTAYHCPVPGWEDHETHVVVRSGPDGLGRWFPEERDLYADYTRWVGAPPGAIVRVWLLASTQRQPSEAQCDYGRIELDNGSQRVRVN